MLLGGAELELDATTITGTVEADAKVVLTYDEELVTRPTLELSSGTCAEEDGG